MSQVYHQEWIGRDGSLNDKLLLNFSNLNTNVVWFDDSLLETFPLKKVWEAVSYLVLVRVIAAKEPVLSISGEGWGARVDHEAPGNVEKQGGEDLLVVEPPVAAVPEEVSLSILPLQGCVHVARQAPPFPDVLKQSALHWWFILSHLGVDVVSYMSIWRPVKFPVVAALKYCSNIVKILDKPWRNIFYHCRPTRKLHPQNLEFQGSPSLFALGNHPERKYSILGKHHFVLHLHFHVSELPVIVALTIKNYNFESFVFLYKATLKK